MSGASSFRLLKSAAFRLVLLYMLLFGVSVAFLYSFIYLATLTELENQVKSAINIQLADLGRRHVMEGQEETTNTIKNLIAKDTSKKYLYMLITPRWRIRAGNIEKWPGGDTKNEEWVTFYPENPEDGTVSEVPAMARTVQLRGGFLLMVGYKLDRVEELRTAMMRVMGWSIVMTLIMGAIGGLILSLIIHRRLEQVNLICRRVMSGSLDERVAVSGAGDEFDHLAENFNEMLSRINELIVGIQQVSYSIAHDLRTPLNRLRNRLEKITLKKMTPGKMVAEVEAAIQETDTIVGTFNAILRIAQAESGAGIQHFEPFDLSDMMQDIADLYGPVAEDRKIRLIATIASGLAINGDRHLLSQAIANLVDNAIKYTPSKGAVSLALTEEGNQAVITVSDTGPGIPPEYYEKVTERFFRIEESRSTPGSGLGLALASAALKLHKGELIFSDNEPGLKVTVVLPLS